jgi:hypothetical protein
MAGVPIELNIFHLHKQKPKAVTFLMMLTVDVQMDLNDLWRVRRNLAFICALVSLVRELDLKSPVVRVLELHGVATVSTVGMQPHSEQLQVVLPVLPPHPRYLAVKRGNALLSLLDLRLP